MSAPPTTQAANTSLARDLIRAARYYVGGWRGVLILTAIALAAGLALKWSCLVAAGIVPIVLTFLPRLVMCGARLCMDKLLGSRSCDSAPSNPDPTMNPSEKRRDPDA